MFAITHLLGELPDWNAWAGPAIGILATLLIFLLGLLLLGRRAGVVRQALQLSSNHDPFLDGSTNERRAWARRGGNPVEVHIATEATKATPNSATIVDRSMGGLRLRLNQPMDEGVVLCVRPVNASTLVPWTDIEVKSCVPREKEWEIGCCFVRPPPWSVLLLFG
jgi:hypothetical protein